MKCSDTDLACSMSSSRRVFFFCADPMYHERCQPRFMVCRLLRTDLVYAHWLYGCLGFGLSCLCLLHRLLRWAAQWFYECLPFGLCFAFTFAVVALGRSMVLRVFRWRKREWEELTKTRRKTEITNITVCASRCYVSSDVMWRCCHWVRDAVMSLFWQIT